LFDADKGLQLTHTWKNILIADFFNNPLYSDIKITFTHDDASCTIFAHRYESRPSSTTAKIPALLLSNPLVLQDGTAQQ